jgi:tRNA threonylcarbamoyladenosine biosynthesis protein TsaB
MNPCLLAIDTSTDLLALGLGTATADVGHVEPGGARASARLLPAVLALLADAGVRLQDVDAIAFGHGPGAFTGLRTACAAAQGLALGAAKPLLPLDSLMIVAEQALPSPQPGDTRWVALDARMDEVYAAAYLRQVDGWRVARAPALYTLAALSALWRVEPPHEVAGNALQVFADRLPLPLDAAELPLGDRAAAMLRLARQAWRAGQGIDAADGLPLYLRDKVALTSAERGALREARSSVPGPTPVGAAAVPTRADSGVGST